MTFTAISLEAGALFLEDREHVSIISIDENYDQNLPGGETNISPRQAIANEYFAAHPDSVDFLIVFTTFEFDTGIATAFHLTVRNDVQGIGSDPVDLGLEFGSAAELDAYVDMAALTRHETNPLRSGFERTLSTLIHEIFHQWAARVRFIADDGQPSSELLDSRAQHWSFLLDSDASLLYGNDWQDNGDGTFTSIDVRRRLSPLDLYLAGLYSASEVPPMLLIDSSLASSDTLPDVNTTISGLARTVTIDDIIAAEGPRTPSFETAQRNFRAAFILVVRPGDSILQQDIVALEDIRGGLLDRFPIVTDGRAVINVLNDDDPGVEVGSPDPLTGGNIRPDPANLNDGLAWLRIQQRPDGSWQDKEHTTPRDTAVTAATLHAIDPAFTGGAAASQWFNANPASNADDLSRSIMTRSSLNDDTGALVAELLSLRHLDGGWGLGSPYTSDPLDTAIAIMALANRVPASTLDQAANLLVSTQMAGGGWSHHGHGASRIVVTTAAINALHASNRADDITTETINWLASRQNPDGGFGDSPSTAHDTANVLNALITLTNVGAIDGSRAMDFLQGSQSVLGSWEGSVYTTSLVVTALNRFNLANWSLVRLTADQQVVSDGDIIRLTAHLVNDSNEFTPTGTLRLFDGDPDAGGIPIDELTVPVMAPGATANATFLWDSFDQAGEHLLMAVIDPDEQVVEASETDNTGFAMVTVEPAPAGIDVTIRSNELLVNPSQPDTIPSDLLISATVRNLGLTDAGSVLVSLWQGEPGTGVLVGEQLTDLPQRSAVAVAMPFTLVTPGMTSFTMLVDSADQVAEVDETNNQATVVVTTTASIDLATSDVDITMNGDPFVGHDVTFTVLLRNLGTTDAPGTAVRYLLIDDTTEIDLQIDTETLAAGAEVVRTIEWRVDRTGNLRFVVQLDPDDLVAERDETNNAGGYDFITSQLNAVNLSVSHQDLTFDPEPGLAGQTVRLEAQVRNTGNQPVAEFNVVFHDGDPAAGGSQIGSAIPVPGLTAGASQTITTTFGPLTGTADRLIFVSVDLPDLVPESNETDNQAFRVLSVLGLPDLALATSSIHITPLFPEPGQTVTATVGLANLGEQDATDITVSLTANGVPTASTVVPLVAASTIAEVVFLLPAAAGTTELVFSADPDDTVVESSEINNSVTVQLTSRDPGELVSHRFFSPNGDGIKDTTTLFFTVNDPGAVTAEVINYRGEVVLWSAIEVLPPEAAFTWLGTNNAGSVVDDGDFTIVVTDGIDRTEAVVTVDTNRSPMFDALETQFARITNLTCGYHSLSQATVTPAEDWVYFTRRQQFGSPFIQEGLHRASTQGGPVEKILSVTNPFLFDVSDDDQRIAYYRNGFNRLWYANTDGSDLTSIITYEGTSFAFRPMSGQDLVYTYESFNGATAEIRLRPLDDPASQSAILNEFARVSPERLSPDGKFLLTETPDGYELINLASGERQPLIPKDPDELALHVRWSPDSSRLAMTETLVDGTGFLRIFSARGQVSQEYRIPTLPIAQIPAYAHLDTPVDAVVEVTAVSPPSWSSTSAELAFTVSFAESVDDHRALYGLIFTADINDPFLQTVAWLEPLVDSNSYHVSTWNGTAWVERGVLHYGLRYHEQELNLGNHLPDANGDYKVRIHQIGHEAAHIERVTLRHGHHRLVLDEPPSSAIGLEDGRDVLPMVLDFDRRTLDAHGRELEFTWPDINESAEGLIDLRLVLVAREQVLDSRPPRSFKYPSERESFYTYVIGDHGDLHIDGWQSEADTTDKPLFVERSYPDSGHPSGRVVGYVTSDTENLYAALDLTIDNTLDGDRDWASLWVRTIEGWKEHRVTVADSSHGVAGFTRTQRAIHDHKYYELRIPLADLGLRTGDTVDLRFEASGSAALLDDGWFMPYGGSDLNWVPQDQTLLYRPTFDPPFVIDLDDNNRVTQAFETFDSFSDTRFSPSGRRLFFRSDEENRDPTHECFNGLTGTSTADWFSYQSLANLTAELQVIPAADGRGYTLEGTASDLHFERYTIEYAAESLPDFWIPLGPTSTTPVYDDVFATFVPPTAEAHLVRLFVFDLAGNNRHVIRHIAGGHSSSVITDLWLSPRYISPGGDGVQDTAILHYTVLEPAHLEITVTNERGDIVRSYQQDHSTIGAEIEVMWNGRDSNGLVVPDGLYAFEVQGFELSVTVDMTPPAVTLELHDALVPAEQSAQPDAITVEPQLTWCINDSLAQTATLATGVGPNPVDWREIKRISLDGASCDSASPSRHLLSLTDFVNHSFRLEATDLAGNSTTVSTDLGGEQLILDGFGWPEPGPVPPDSRPLSLERGTVRLSAASTVRQELVSLEIQARPAGGSSWLTLPQPFPALNEHRLDLSWDLNEIELGVDTEVRLRSIDLLGSATVSNSVHLSVGGLSYQGIYDQSDPSTTLYQQAIDSAISAAGLPADATVMWAFAVGTDPLVDITLVLESDDDPNFATSTPVPMAARSGPVFIFHEPLIRPCRSYDGFVIASTDPSSEPRTYQSNHELFRLPCLDLDVLIAPVPEGRASNLIAVTLTPTSFNDIELRTLSIAVGDPNNIIFNINNPISGESHYHEIDVFALPEGNHPLYARISNGDGEEATINTALVVDRSPPTIEITSPLAGQPLCGVQQDGHSIVEIEGRITDRGEGLILQSDPPIFGFQLGCNFYDSTLSVGSSQTGGCPPPDLPVLPFEELSELSLVGSLGQISDFTGQVTLRLVVSDWGGQAATSETSFFVDGLVEGANATIDRNLFSPNGDALADEVVLHVFASEAVTIGITVYQAINGIGGPQPVGPVMRVLADGLVSFGDEYLPWDGLDGDGSIVPDGMYVAVVDLIDACGNERQLFLGMTVDATPPVTVISAPASGQISSAMVEIWGTANDPHLSDYRLEVGIGTSPTTWQPLSSGTSSVSNALLSLWGTTGLTGDHVVRLVATDTVGNQGMAMVAVDLTGNDGPIVYLEATPDLISPNSDQQADSTAIRFALNSAATLSLDITDQVGTTVVRSLIIGELISAGASERTWNGRDQLGMVAPDARYMARLRADTGATVHEESITVVIDTTSPSIVISRPLYGFVNGTGSVIGSIDDSHLTAWTAWLTDDLQAETWVRTADGTSPITDEPIANLDGLAEGDYGLRISASDRGGNRAELRLDFTIDNTDPVVELSVPADGTAISGETFLMGVSAEAHPETFLVEVGAGVTPTAWTIVADGLGQPAWPIPWNTTPLTDGLHTLRLIAIDQAGNQGAASSLIRIDNTLPSVVITSPVNGGFVTVPTSVEGTAADDDLFWYRLEIAPPGIEQWSLITIGATTISGGILGNWNALPQDGPYRLRLSASDHAGSVAATSIDITVDTTPPEPPTGLTGTVNGSGEVELTWLPSTAGDLAGYRVYRGTVLITSGPVLSPEHSDTGASEGVHLYTVTAIDHAGLESDPSEPAEINVDRTPPSTSIHSPRTGSRVAGLIDLKITAMAGDLDEYRIFAGLELIFRSTVTAAGETVTQWNTIGTADGPVTLRLEAEDVSGNLGVSEVEVVVDGTAPGKPTGLTATPTAADVDLSWNDNPEPDVIGYLLMRNGSLLGVPAGFDDLRPFAIDGTAFSDVGLADGQYDWNVIAIDEAGNLSPPSDPAAAFIDQRAPRAQIALPEHGARIDRLTFILATSPDGDLAEIRFEYQAAGDIPWIEIETDNVAPWQSHFDPLPLSYGDFLLRAVATDLGGQTDPAPASITITYTDLERPAATVGVNTLIDGANITVNWQANTEADMAGYFVDRSDSFGNTVRLATALATDTALIDTGVAEGIYSYVLTAFDSFDNEADPSTPASATVYTPILEAPYSPTQETVISLLGSGAPDGTVTIVVSNPESGTVSVGPEPTNADGTFILTGLPLTKGLNTLIGTITDGDGNTSKPAATQVLHDLPPGLPTGLAATVTGFVVDLRWDSNPEPDVVGYRVLRNGELRTPSTRVPSTDVIAATASSSYSASFPPNSAIDGSSSSYWAPQIDSDNPSGGQWWAIDLLERKQLTAITVEWASANFRAVDFDLEALHLGSWMPIAEVRGNNDRVSQMEVNGFYGASAVRLVIRSIARPDDDFRPLRLAEVKLFEIGSTATPEFSETVPADGYYSYAVTAFNENFESAPTTAIEAAVGDVVPPEPLILSVAVIGSDVSLSWTASTAPDLASYSVYRDGAVIANLASPSHLDTALVNGVYNYIVRAVDLSGNASDPSNQVTATVAQTLLEAPTGLSVSAPAAGSVLELSWQAGAGATPAAFEVSRSLVSGGPFTSIAQVITPSYLNLGLTNGTSYFYIIEARDVIGNPSPASSEASGIPRDIQGPDAPTLTLPVQSGQQYLTPDPLLNTLAGIAEPGSRVVISRSGSPVAETTASTAATVLATGVNSYATPRLSPDGRHLWFDDSNSHQLFTFEGAELDSIGGISRPVRWYPSSDRVVSWAYDSTLRKQVIFTLRIVDGTIDQLAATDRVDAVLPTPDGLHLGVLGAHLVNGNPVYGLWLVNPAESQWSLVTSTDIAPNFDLETLRFSPTGDHFAYLRRSPDYQIEIVDMVTGGTTTVLTSSRDGFGWSPDGESIVFSDVGSNGWLQVFSFDLTSGRSQLTDSHEDHESPRFLADGRSIVCVIDGQTVSSQDLDSGRIVQLHELTWWDGLLETVPSGYVLVSDDSQPLRLNPAGWFQANWLQLEVGDNWFAARAIDAADNSSQLSDEILVTLVDSGLPDLFVGGADIAVVPTVPILGETAQASITVHNGGGSWSGPSELIATLVEPAGSFVDLGRFDFPAIPAGGTFTISKGLDLLGGPGTYRIITIIDPLDRIAEAVESNNRGEAEFVVLAEAAPVLTVITNRTAYGSNEQVQITVDLLNGGPTFNGRLEILVEDTAGYPAELLPIIEIVDLQYGESSLWNLTWSTGSLFAGDYRINARLYDSLGVPLISDLAEFIILDSTDLSASVITDWASYSAGDTVFISSTVTYDVGNSVLADAQATVEVIDSSGAIIEQWQHDLGDLLPGSGSSFDNAWSSAGRAPGSYRVNLSIFRAGQPVAVGTTAFDLLTGQASLTGQLGLNLQAPGIGVPVVVSLSVLNEGSAALLSVPITLMLLEPQSGLEQQLYSQTVNLDVGQSFDSSVTVVTDNLDLASFLVVLRAELDDGARGAVAVTLATASFTTADRTAPLVTIDRPEASGYLGATRLAVVTALDSLSPITIVELSLDGGPWRSMQPHDLASGRFAVVLDDLTEGDHLLVAAAEDSWSNRATTVEVPFIADLTAPLIIIEGVVDNMTYTTAVTPVITIVDDYLDFSAASLNGQQFTSGTVVSDDAVYQLAVVAEDEAGNRSQSSVRFTIGAPVIPTLMATKTDTLLVDADGSGVVSPGDTLGYAISVDVLGQGELSNLELNDQLPAGVSLVPASLTTSHGVVLNQTPVQVHVDTVAAGTTIDIQLAVLLDGAFAIGTTVLSNQGLITSDQLRAVLTDDPDQPGGTDPTTTEVVIEGTVPSIWASKTVALAVDLSGDGVASPGDTLSYTVTVGNSQAGSEATAMTVFDPIPGYTVLVGGSVTATSGIVLSEDPVEVWLASLGAETVLEITFEVVIDPGLPQVVSEIMNQAQITATEVPLVLSDDPAAPGLADPTVISVSRPDVSAMAVTKTDWLLFDADGNGIESPGDRLGYAIVIDNIGSTDLTTVELDDTMPALTVVMPGSVTTTQGVIVSEAPVLVDLGSINPGAAATVTVEILLSGPFGAGTTDIANQAVVRSAELADLVSDDPSVPGTGDPTTTTVTYVPPPLPVLTASKTALLVSDLGGDGQASPGDQLEYLITIVNSGQGSATVAGLSDQIPGYTAIVPGSVSTTQGSVINEDPVEVDLGVIAASGGCEIRFRVTIDAGLEPTIGSITNQGQLFSAELQPIMTDDPTQPGNSDPTVTVIGGGVPMLTASKTAELVIDLLSDGMASPGDTVEYTITVTNSGGGPATGVSLHDQIPQHTTVVPGSVSGGSVTSENPVEVELGSIAAGTQTEVRFRVVVDTALKPGTRVIVNQGQIDSTELGPLLTDDPAVGGTQDPTYTTVNLLGISAIPFLDPRGLLIFIFLILVAGMWVLRTRS